MSFVIFMSFHVSTSYMNELLSFTSWTFGEFVFSMLPMVAIVTKVFVLIIYFLNSLSFVLQSSLHQEQKFKV
jgi:hypothetical protein